MTRRSFSIWSRLNLAVTEYCRDCAPVPTPVEVECSASQNPATRGLFCVCTNGFTTLFRTSKASCPTTIPPHWTTKSPQPVAAPQSTQIPFSYYNVSNGALVHCASSVVSVLDVWTAPITETYCAGSTSTDSNSMGVASTTSLFSMSLSSVIEGNWGYYTMSVSSGSGSWNPTSASYNLMAKFYTAFSSACSSSTVSTITTTATLSLETFSNLPGGGKGSVTKLYEPVTYYACDSNPVSVTPWTVQDSDDASGLDPSGTLYARMAYSRFSPENLDAWLWLLAFRYAYATVNSLTYSSISREEGRAMVSLDYPFFTIPRQIQLQYNDDINEMLEQMTVQITWQDDSSNSLICEIIADIMIALMSFFQPEIDEALVAMDIEISATTRNIIQRGVKRGLRMGCAEEGEDSYA